MVALLLRGPGILGHESSSSVGEGAGRGDASLPREGEVASTGLRCPVAGLVEVSKDEAEASSPVALSRGVGF